MKDSLSTLDKRSNKKLAKIFFYFLFIVSILLFAYYILINFGLNTQLQQNQDKIINLTNFKVNGQPKSLEYRPLEEAKRMKFKTTISKEEFSNLATSDYKIVINRLQARWYKVYFNDTLIDSVGDIKEGNSNIWNALNDFSIDNKLIQENNELTIEIFAVSHLGLINHDVIITDHKFSNQINDYLTFFMKNLHLVIIGILIISFLLLIFIYHMETKIGREYLYYSLATLSLIISSLKFLTINQLPLSLLNFQKIVYSANTLIIVFFSLALYKQFENKINLFLIYPVLGGLGLIFFISNLNDLNDYYTQFFNWVILTNILGWCYTTAKNLKRSYEARLLLLLIVFSSYDVLDLLTFNTIFPGANIGLFRYLTFALAMIFLIILHYNKLQEEIAYENARSELMYERSIKDQMTGAYNHQYIISKLRETDKQYSLIMIDIDDFKEINDNHGHQIGDKVIKHVAQEIKETKRDSDILGRYGGDEFTLILFNCSTQNAKKVAQRIKTKIAQAYQINDGTEIKITLSIGIYNSQKDFTGESALEKADTALYRAKKTGKNKIKVYST